MDDSHAYYQIHFPSFRLLRLAKLVDDLLHLSNTLLADILCDVEVDCLKQLVGHFLGLEVVVLAALDELCHIIAFKLCVGRRDKL